MRTRTIEREDILEILRKLDDSARALDAIRRLAELTLGEKLPKGRNRRGSKEIEEKP